MAKTQFILILAENALYSEALLAQIQQSEGLIATSIAPDEFDASPPEAVAGSDIVILIGDKTAVQEKALRGKFYRGPVLHLSSAANAAEDQDHMPMPVRYPALLQKLRSLAGSYWFRDDVVIEIGCFALRPAFKELARGNDAPIALTDKEVEILLYLYRAGGKIISREVLLAEIWGYNAEVSTHTLETHIYRLRQKIEAELDAGGLLITEAGGYRLNQVAGE